MSINKFTSDIIQDSLISIGEAMFETIQRTSMSPIIYEALDYAVGITDDQGRLLAQGNGVVAFLGSIGFVVEETIRIYKNNPLKKGDIIIANTPYAGGGTHLSDIAIITPVFYRNELIAFTVNKAHWTDIGGTNPGSVSTISTEIFQEGLHFPFVKIKEEGKYNDGLLKMLEANVRLPKSTLGDLRSGIAANDVGASRIIKLIEKYGLEAYRQAAKEFMEYGERISLSELSKIPTGVYENTGWVENDGLGNGPFPLKLRLEIRKDKMICDFTGSHEQLKGPLNLSGSGLQTAVRAAFKAITTPALPANNGSFKHVEVICPDNTILNASSPAPTSIYYEVLLATIDLLLKTLGPIVPEKLPAGHFRSVCVTYISGVHPVTNEFYVQAEPLSGGWGACAYHDGNRGQFSYGHGESYNIPAETRERKYGVMVEEYAFHNEGGGYGEFQGGNGQYLTFRILSEEAFLTGAFLGYSIPMWGLLGGKDGSYNYFKVIRKDGSEETYNIVTNVKLTKGDRVKLVTATGGGYGKPENRPKEKITTDIKNMYITEDQAKEHYNYIL
ncbi:hydantoinase B/oxoprolinase family protein [Elizabethkingia anophelis]|uniref:hydantoinase B/oxoprolinase family protein n=1 Tax=Elizabethkingia anophelis TaxID=1117645 RepID=UPI001625FED2|nr:hydantoinase B/oxoprolinase family protein [Elizabethkingia anophelis]MCT4214554.1 hydantoinase B/oxoprolinase family protein [Elizabethkingia anophelis]MCT4323379.1 hydantoinase B/oxoprolinase family protein [Elizabethkingia anophelis]HAY3535755.1 hydantoinase B/oxoprolinase family protein [Elizabethkingia anophelis]HAY3547972.1 hydantoinase B/oxoprolinase family protein [Elizabethkingia anophelis]HAY3592781.1 hydantoinase B/oxoprolinase family protein [Elizabethkingia anophelis]